MEVFLDDRELDINNEEINKTELLKIIQNQLDQAIIDKVYLDEDEISYEYFTSKEINIDDFEKIEVISKKTEKLIKETLQEAKKYLPELKQGLGEIARLMKRKETELAGNKFLLALEGFEWYTGVLSNLRSLIDNKELQQQIEDILAEFSNLIKEALNLQKENKREELADMLSGDIEEMVDEFISLNERLISSGSGQFNSR